MSGPKPWPPTWPDAAHEVRVDGRSVLVQIEHDETYDHVRDAIVDLGLAMIRIEQRRSKLEDLFRDEAGRATALHDAHRGRGMNEAPVTTSATEGRGGNIYDLGYRGYEGVRLGRGAVIGALLTHSLRTAYGLGRNARSKIMPVGLAVLAILPALLALGIIALVSQIGRRGRSLRGYLADPLRHPVPVHRRARVPLLRLAGARTVRARPASRHPAAVFLTCNVAPGLCRRRARWACWSSLLVLVLAPQLLLFVGRVLVAEDLFERLVRRAAQHAGRGRRWG